MIISNKIKKNKYYKSIKNIFNIYIERILFYESVSRIIIIWQINEKLLKG